jgi:hypothetical protein
MSSDDGTMGNSRFFVLLVGLRMFAKASVLHVKRDKKLKSVLLQKKFRVNPFKEVRR